MNVIVRSTSQFLTEVRTDLLRPHPFAMERVGFISMKAANTPRSLVLLACGYYPVEDDDYLDDPTVGAMMGSEAIRKALNIALLQPVGMFHVHVHDHVGRPDFSYTDVREQFKFVPDFFKVGGQMPHGALVLSQNRTAGRVWLAPNAVIDISEFNSIGPQTVVEVGDLGSGELQ